MSFHFPPPDGREEAQVNNFQEKRLGLELRPSRIAVKDLPLAQSLQFSGKKSM